MSTPIPIQRPATDTFEEHSVSSSPPLTRQRGSEYGTSPLQSSPIFTYQGPSVGVRQKVLKPFATEELRLLLLENISQDAVRAFKDLGFQVDSHKKAFSEAELLESIGKYHAIGIRSKTKLTARVLKAATKAIDLDTAARAGIPVFNSPFSNSRSVAELVMSEIIALSRQLFERAYEMRAGTWNKLSAGCWEIRGKTLGIVGYGHIGSQLSVLAEAFGMRVVYYDVLNLMPLGSATQVQDLDSLLGQSDFVTLHVPELPETTDLIGAKQLARMRRGSYLINNARGKVVDIPALIDAIESKRLAGAALDVYPVEPGGNGQPFDDQLNSWGSRLRALPNVILTPHIGGSTEEAQRMIGFEVSSAVARYLSYGATLGAVNFPEVDLRAITAEQADFIRVCYVHHNQPGVLRQLNEILSDHNVEKQYSDSKGDVAYLMADISKVSEADIQDIHDRISHTKANIITRLLT
ncbi:hypothetical protein FRC10_009610 [Ceratobasidium sp. 414]|nr:hypothetical protein FRC10_009610 [Ceratobasidium sp. 414]